MIEVTNEMVCALNENWPNGVARGEGMRLGLIAVMAIVERDMAEQAKREWDALEYCPSTSPDCPEWHCERQTGHEGPHRAMRWDLEWA